MNPENRWVKKADLIPWDEIEDRYAGLFPSHTGIPAKPLRAALGSLIIQKKYGYSDRELVEQITENPYYQYFIGLHGYQQKAPYAPSLLVEFRKRLTDEIFGEINEMIIRYNHPDDPGPGNMGSGSGDSDPSENSGTLILDATCAPQNIAYPHDINLLNEAREDLEAIIDTVCRRYDEPKPRTYRRNARKDYLSLEKQRRRSTKAIRKAIKKKEGVSWLIFGSIWTVGSIGIFIIFPILIQVKDLGVCLALGAFLVILGPAFFFCGVQKLKEAKRFAKLPVNTRIKNPNAVLFGIDDGAACEIATKYYCEKFGKKELTDEDNNIVWDWVYDEISYLLAWIFENGYYNPDYTEKDLAELAEKIAKREAIPSDYMNYDASFFEGNVKDEVLDFVKEYLENSEFIKGHYVPGSGMIIGAYFYEVETFAKERLNAPLLGFPFTWEDYDAFKGHIDEAYAKYKSK